MKCKPARISLAAPHLAGLAPQALAAAPAPAAARGQVVFFEGEVRIDGVPAEIGAGVGTRALVETGTGATCEIVFDRRNVVRVGQEAVAVLDFAGPRKDVELRKGGLTSVLRKLGKVAGADSFRVSTPTAVAGVRGTSFCVWVDENSSYVCACNGSVRTIDDLGSNEQTLSSPHHVARTYTREGGSIAVAPAGVEHHSDASVESLAARIGEKVNWSKLD
jgi:hypothetical protein